MIRDVRQIQLDAAPGGSFFYLMDMIYIKTMSGTLYCFSEDKHTLLWKYDMHGTFQPDKSVDPRYAGIVYMLNFRGDMTTIGAEKGALAWSLSMDTVVEGVRTYNQKMFAVSADGRIAEMVRRTGENPSFKQLLPPGLRVLSFDIFDDDGVFLTLGGEVFVYDMRDYSLRWSRKLPAPLMEMAYQKTSSGLLHFCNGFGEVFALRLQDGKEVWRRPLLPGPGTNVVHAGTNSFVCGHDGQMVAFDSNTGEPKWRTRLKGRVTEAPAIADELCVVADDLGWVYHVRLADGKITESKRIGAPGRVAYDIRKGVLHYLDGAGVMHFVRLKRAEPKVVEEKVTEERVVRRKKAVKRKVVKTNKPTTQSLKVDQTVHLGELNWDTIVKHSEGSMLRGAPSRHGLVKGHGLTQLDSVAWSFKTPSGVFAQPVLALGGEVLVIADTSGNVYGLEEATGRKRWHFKAKSAVWGTPACAGGVACFGDYQKNFYALDVETGNLAWQFKADGDVFSSAIIVDELVYFNTNKGVVYALDLETGTIDWKEEVTKGSMFPSPGIWGRRIFVGGNKGPLVALNRHNGIQRWERKLKLVDYTIPTCSEEFIYVNTTEGAVALEPENGKTIWKSKFGKGDAQPALSPEFVYLTDSQQMVALDPLEGKKEWEYKKRFGYSAPVVCGDMVYAGTYGDGIVALNRFTGKKLWSHKTNRDVWSTVLVHDEGGKIVVADYGGTVYSLHLRQNGAHEHQIPPRISLFPPL